MTNECRAVERLRTLDMRADAVVAPVLRDIGTLPADERARRQHWAVGLRYFARLKAIHRVEKLPRDEMTLAAMRLLREHTAMAARERDELRALTKTIEEID